MLIITKKLRMPIHEIELHATRSQGPGGQNVNKVSTAIHLRFDIEASSLPLNYKEKLMQLNDARITQDGIIVIKAQRYRTQDKNRDDALERLAILIKKATQIRKTRKKSRPTKASKKKQLDSKTRHGKLKVLRGKNIKIED